MEVNSCKSRGFVLKVTWKIYHPFPVTKLIVNRELKGESQPDTAVLVYSRMYTMDKQSHAPFAVSITFFIFVTLPQDVIPYYF